MLSKKDAKLLREAIDSLDKARLSLMGIEVDEAEFTDTVCIIEEHIEQLETLLAN